MERMGAWKAREEYSKTRPLIVLERNPQRTEERSEGPGNTLTRQKLAATRPGKRGRGVRAGRKEYFGVKVARYSTQLNKHVRNTKMIR